MIQASGVAKTLGGREILHDLTFGTNRGITALLGPNGAGKTTLLNILSTLSHADRGDITIAGLNIVRQPIEIKQILGFQPEFPPLHPMVRPRELYAAIGAVRELPWSAFVETAARFGAEELMEQQCGAMSQGQRRLVTLIAAIAHRPRVLLLDEPTNALDPHRVAELKRYLTSDEAPEMTLISTHQLDFVATLTDQFLLLSEGRLVGSGTLDDLRARFDLHGSDIEEIVLKTTKPR